MTSTEPVHSESETHPWTIDVGNHPTRTDSAEYVAAKKLMNEIAAGSTGLIYGQPPYQDHHGGALWLKDAQGWFLVRNLAGIEWSAQFCADPAKVDLLRQNAKRLYDLLSPDVKQQLDPGGLLDTPITDAPGVATWTDSIFNAGVPLQPSFHIGVVPGSGKNSGVSPNAAGGQDPDPNPDLSGSSDSDPGPDPSGTPDSGTSAAPDSGASPASSSGPAAATAPAASTPTSPPSQEPGGVHHYPTPIADIQLFKYDDFQLWVTDAQGNPAAVAPVAPRGSGNASIHVLYATPGSQLAQQKDAAESVNAPLILGADHSLAQQAFQHQ
jgi:Family of unknown function (DUF6424)